MSDLQILIATKNGSGSQTANRLLHKALFREGYHVVGKNIFPSNIEGLPAHYLLRISKSYNSIKPLSDIYVGLNPDTFLKDSERLLQSDAIGFSNEDLKILNSDERPVVSFRKLSQDMGLSIKVKKRISNLFYVGWLAGLLGLKEETFKTLIHESFKSEELCEKNFFAFRTAYDFFNNKHFNDSRWFEKFKSIQNLSQNLKGIESSKEQILIEGNQSAALSWVDAGCTFATWYPITPSTSLVESFESYVEKLRPQKLDSEKPYAVLQTEDEISAIGAVIGASWSGLRAATATSGPGLSLMNEAIGLAYFAEVPSVIWDVQRVGPSTGLPTRTSQGDLLAAYYSSHGDSFHPILLPANPKEAFEMGMVAFDVAETYQSPVFVLSDLDLGMNAWSIPKLEQSPKPLERGKVLSEVDLENIPDFKRYLGDENGIASRTLPGTHHPLAAYMTRGSGHAPDASYSEDPSIYNKKILRLKKKILKSREMLPLPQITQSSNEVGLVYYGSTEQIFPEVLDLLHLSKSKIDLCCIKSLPLHDEVYDFVQNHKTTLVVEQNRDLQMLQIIKAGLPSLKNQILGVSAIDGWPIQAQNLIETINSLLSKEL